MMSDLEHVMSILNESHSLVKKTLPNAKRNAKNGINRCKELKEAMKKDEKQNRIK